MKKSRHKNDRMLNLTGFTCSVVLGVGAFGCDVSSQRRARLESHRSSAMHDEATTAQLKAHSNDGPVRGNAQLFASSLMLLREDFLPCESLPPRRLIKSDGGVAWVDGSWSKLARPYVIKGSAKSALCSLEIRPKGSVVLNPGEKDAFVRGHQIQILLAAPNGDTLISQPNQGIVHCTEQNGTFDISFEGKAFGHSRIGYVMNEALPLELDSRICLARLLNEERKLLNDWVFVVPSWEQSENTATNSDVAR